MGCAPPPRGSPAAAQGSGPSTAVVAGAVVGAVVALALAGLGAVILIRRRRDAAEEQRYKLPSGGGAVDVAPAAAFGAAPGAYGTWQGHSAGGVMVQPARLPGP
jgi:LPXTG-motif cell wall-anchored protein